MKRIIAITGGIGSGKSVVSRILAVMGYPVYDCDSRAKALMDSSDEIKRRLVAEVDSRAVVDGVIDRRRIADVVFADDTRLKTLNSIVHSHVRADIVAWSQRQDPDTVFVETAILAQSGLDSLVREQWLVTAPDELRVWRVMRRSRMTHSEVLSRMASQVDAVVSNIPTRIFVNDECRPLLPQIVASL